MRGLTGELVDPSPNVFDHRIHRRRDTVVAVSGHEFGQSPRVQPTTRSLQSTRKTLSFVKNVVRD
ncbi:MAG: hypothetical protein NTY19_06750 [Planctomycetota bacterium]|nr:hypothetical protein [Planctomycetota bacterium]